MKRKFSIFALAILGMSITACGGSGSVGLDYDDSDLDIDTEWTEYSIPITKVNFDDGEDNLVIERGTTYEYSYTVEPKKAVKKSLTWESSNTDVVTVSQGVLTGVGAGKAIIYVSNNEKSFNTISLNVEVIVPVTDISFEQTTLLADLNKDYQLSVDYTPFDTTEKGVTWHVENEEIATISDAGLLTTKGVTGVTTVTANSAYINKTISLTIDVADRTIYPDQVVIEEYENTIEVGKNFTMKARSVVSSDSSVMPTHPEVKYYSSDPSILTVEEDTGIVHAFEAGSTTIYATAIGKNGTISSELKTVNVFEVKVQTINLEDITLSNRNGRSDVTIPLTYTTDTEGYDVASIPNFKYTIGDETVAKVNDNGKLHAVAPSGETTLKVEETRSGVSKTVNVHVGYEVDSVTVTGVSEIDAGKSTSLSVVTEPAGVVAGLITYSSSNPSVASVSNDGLVTGLAEGETTITITVTGMNKTVTETHDIKVNIPDIPFAYDMSYVVGDHNYYSGVSTPSTTGSWDKANQAKAIDESVQTSHDTLLFERRAIIKFNEGDIWKIRTASEYLETDGYKEGLSYLVGEYKVNEGAFAGSHPDMTVTSDRNIVVNRTGYYAIYHAQYTNDHPEGWYSIYVGRHELNLSDTTPQIQINKSTVLEAHDWQGDLSYEITEGSSLISVVRGTGSENYKFTVTAGENAGTAKIVFTDSFKSVEVIVTISSEAPLPKTFEANIPYVVGNADYHTGVATGSGSYWGSDASKAMKFTASTSPLPEGAIAQYEASITFEEDNEFKVVIGGDPLYWDVGYEKETGDVQNAFSRGQMSQQGSSNVVVNSEGTYKIYVKCYNDDRGWQAFIEPKTGGDPTPGEDVPSEDGYYLVGSRTEFKYEGAVKMSAGEGTDFAKLIGYVPLEGEEFRIRSYINTTDTWYNWGDAEEGHEDDNYVVGANVESLDVYLNSEGKFYVVEHKSVTPPTPGEFDDSKVTEVLIEDQTGKGFTSYGVDIKLHIFNITFADYSPITSVSGLKEAGVTIGDAVVYNTTDNVIDVTMTWLQNNPVKYKATLPAYIESCTICVYNTNNVYVHEVNPTTQVIGTNSYQFSTTRGNGYSLYLFNNLDPAYDAWISGSAFNTPLSLVKANA